MTCGERVKELRKTLGLTLEKFGEPLGVTKVAISNIENDNRNMTEQMTKAICREYNVSEEWLRNGTGEMFVPVTRDEEIEIFIGNVLRDEPDNFKKRLISVLAKLSKHEWEVLEEKARWLVQESEAQKKGTDYFSPRSALMW